MLGILNWTESNYGIQFVERCFEFLFLNDKNSCLDLLKKNAISFKHSTIQQAEFIRIRFMLLASGVSSPPYLTAPKEHIFKISVWFYTKDGFLFLVSYISYGFLSKRKDISKSHTLKGFTSIAFYKYRHSLISHQTIRKIFGGSASSIQFLINCFYYDLI